MRSETWRPATSRAKTEHYIRVLRAAKHLQYLREGVDRSVRLLILSRPPLRLFTLEAGVTPEADETFKDRIVSMYTETWEIYRSMRSGTKNFWEAVRTPYLNRDLNRSQVRLVIRRGLQSTGGSYKGLLRLFHVEESKYTKFMDFLRNHRLRPDDA